MAPASIAADPSGAPSAESEGPPLKRLVLASEALREDLAPLEPGGAASRWIIGGIALALGLLGVAMREGLRVNGTTGSAASITLAAAGATAAIAFLPFSYRVRAVVVALLGGALMVLGTDATGPLAGLRTGNPSAFGTELSRLVTLAVLPGALLFRARYRAYPRARLVLGLALVAALPFAVSRGFAFAASTATLADRAAAGLDMAVILAGLFGFMGAHTTGGGSVWAALVLGVLSADIALSTVDTATGLHAWLIELGTAVGTACATTLAALGAYYLLAIWLARDARREAEGEKTGSRATLA